MQQKSAYDWSAAPSAFVSARADAALRLVRGRTYCRLELTFPTVGIVTALLSADISDHAVDVEGLVWRHGEVVCALDGSFPLAGMSLQSALEAAVLQRLRSASDGGAMFGGCPRTITFASRE